MGVPRWAQDLTIQVAIDEGRDALPDLTWRHRQGQHTSGHTKHRDYGGGVVITAGKCRKDQKLVLLHELAHWLLPHVRHNGEFWDKAWELFHRYNVPIRYAREREGLYLKGSIAAYHRSRSVTSERPLR